MSEFQIFSQNKQSAMPRSTLIIVREENLLSLVSKFWQTMFCHVHALVCAALAPWAWWNLTDLKIALSPQIKANSKLLDICWSTDQSTAQALKKHSHQHPGCVLSPRALSWIDYHGYHIVLQISHVNGQMDKQEAIPEGAHRGRWWKARQMLCGRCWAR